MSFPLGVLLPDSIDKTCTAFKDCDRLAAGDLITVALAVKAALDETPAASILVFDDITGAVIDLDLRGSHADIVARLGARFSSTDSPEDLRRGKDDVTPAPGRGRPKLGVVSREVTLLPRHWQWLAIQSGGASQALRRLVDEARQADGGRSAARVLQEAAYRFMSALAGNLAGFEEASRALFAGDRDRFMTWTAAWPADIRAYAVKLAWNEKAAVAVTEKAGA